jgi:hypothetical protein
MPKQPSFAKRAIIEARLAAGLEVYHKKRLYTEKEWEIHIKSLKKAKNHAYWLKHKEEIREKKGRMGKSVIRVPIWWVCDWCGNEFFRKPKYSSRIGKHNFSFCSYGCSHKYTKASRRDAKKAKIAEENLKWVYQIITVSKYTQRDCLDKYLTKKEALAAFKQFITENKKIVLPRKIHYQVKKEKQYNDEILLLKLNLQKEEESYFPNEMGILVKNHIKGETNWNVFNKHIWNVEELFYVFGHSTKGKNKIPDRDTPFIMENLIDCDTHTKTIFIYGKYLIIKSIEFEEKINLVYGTHVELIINLYNCLERIYTKSPNNVVFMGTIENSPSLMEIYDEIIKEKTIE